jgi:protein-tyrosine-phosphatase
MNILFVCTANISRSYMAERILKKKLRDKKRTDVVVSSAGLYDMGGAPGDPPAADLLARSGFDGSGHHSRLLTEAMIDEADKVVVMEESHRKALRELYPGKGGKVSLLKSYSPASQGSDVDIKDCHKKSNYHYRLCFAEIYESIEGLMRCI